MLAILAQQKLVLLISILNQFIFTLLRHGHENVPGKQETIGKVLISKTTFESGIWTILKLKTSKKDCR